MTMSLPTRYLGTIALTLALGAVFYIGTFLYQIGALVSAEYWIYDAQVVKHELLARNQDKNKLIFAAGSSAFFGIDSQRVEQALGMPTINLGLHIGRPVHFLLNEMTPYLKRGDVVVLPLEPVMPTIGAGHRSKNSWVALDNGMPRAAASTRIGRSGGTPGLTNSTSVSRVGVGGWPPRTN